MEAPRACQEASEGCVESQEDSHATIKYIDDLTLPDEHGEYRSLAQCFFFCAEG